MKKFYDAIVTPDYIVVKNYGVFAYLTRLGTIYHFETGHLTWGLAVVVNGFGKQCFVTRYKELLDGCRSQDRLFVHIFVFLLQLGEFSL